MYLERPGFKRRCPRCRIVFRGRLRASRFCSKVCSGLFNKRLSLKKHRKTWANKYGQFWHYVDCREGDDACWMWMLGKSTRGYGMWRNGRKREYTHRVAWKKSHGKIPRGKHVLHTCDNPSCVRPSHLFLGNHKDNMYDAFRKGRALAKTFGPKAREKWTATSTS
jgi:hypothetical protein